MLLLSFLMSSVDKNILRTKNLGCRCHFPQLLMHNTAAHEITL